MDYQWHYDRLVETRKKRGEPAGYKEVHHIVPRSMGGSDCGENLVALTAREHYVAHLLLAKIHGGVAWAALWIMANGKGKNRGEGFIVSSRVYAEARAGFSAWMRENHPFRGKKNISVSAFRGWTSRRGEVDWRVVNRIHASTGFECGWRYRGHTWTQDRKKSRELFCLGKYFAAYGNRGSKNTFASNDVWIWQRKGGEELVTCTISEGEEKYGIKRSTAYGCTYGDHSSSGDWVFIGPYNPPSIEESRLKKIIARRDRVVNPRVECPHCGKYGGLRNMRRYHFDKCKHREVAE